MTGDGADARAPGSAVDARQQQGAKICGEVYHQMYVFCLKRVPFFPARLEDLSKKMRSQCH